MQYVSNLRPGLGPIRPGLGPSRPWTAWIIMTLQGLATEGKTPGFPHASPCHMYNIYLMYCTVLTSLGIEGGGTSPDPNNLFESGPG